MKAAGKRLSPDTRWSLALALLLLLAALGASLWIRSRLASQQKSIVEDAVRGFQLTQILGRPESRYIDFQELETLVEATQNDLILEVYVTKITEQGEELTVHPFYADLTRPGWQEQARWTQRRIGPADRPLGNLYLLLDGGALQAVNGVIALLGIVLAGGLGFFLLRQRGSEVRIGELTQELEARKAQIIRLEKLALAGQLSANLLHDVKKPVLNIKHEVADALDGMQAVPEEVYRVVYSQTELYLELLRDVGIEAFVNDNAEDAEWCDLREIADRSLRLVRYEQGDVEVTVEFEEGADFLIEGLPHRLVQIFSNLILNAFQAMGDSGRLRINGSRQNGRIVVDFEDSGPGIPPDQWAGLFEPFVTTRAEEGGSGLGLFICRQIAEEMGATLQILDGDKLGGARFRLDFPLSE